MKINADLNERAVADTTALPWVPSPSPGVDRRMLDRDGEEVARATSLVKYAEGSSFPTHEHGGGEEFLVLEGVFQDEAGDFPAGTYVRNPVGSAHAPGSQAGCVILVKLHQMDPADQAHVVIDTNAAEWPEAGEDGIARLLLHRFNSEQVAMERWSEGSRLSEIALKGGKEMFVLDGRFEDADGTYGPGAWLRLPSGASHALTALSDGRIWVKRGHL